MLRHLLRPPGNTFRALVPARLVSSNAAQHPTPDGLNLYAGPHNHSAKVDIVNSIASTNDAPFPQSAEAVSSYAMVAGRSHGATITAAKLDDRDVGNPQVVVSLKLPESTQPKELMFPLPLLRDSCTSNFHATTLQRLTPMCRAILETQAASIKLVSPSKVRPEQITGGMPPSSGLAAASAAAEILEVSWGDSTPIRTAAFPNRWLAKTSYFTADWLADHALDEASRAARGCLPALARKIRPLFATEFASQREASVQALSGDNSKIPGFSFDFASIMEDDRELLWLIRRLWCHGLVFISGLPNWKDEIDLEYLRTLSRVHQFDGGAEAVMHFLGPGGANDLEVTCDKAKEACVERLSQRISYARQTNYGIRFHVKAKANANNQAYTNQALQLHSDLPFYKMAPDVQMLHCVGVGASSSGGASVFSDGVAAAYRLREQYPDKYKLLTEKKVQFSDWSTNGEFELHDEKPIITEVQDPLNPSRPPMVTHIHLNEGVRCHLLNSCDASEVRPLYDAIVTLLEILDEPDLRIEFCMEPGQMVIWNNNRVLHGRNGFTVGTLEDEASMNDDQMQRGKQMKSVVSIEDLLQKQGSYRHLVGGYVDWDDALSRMRVLERQLKC